MRELDLVIDETQKVLDQLRSDQDDLLRAQEAADDIGDEASWWKLQSKIADLDDMISMIADDMISMVAESQRGQTLQVLNTSTENV